MPPPELLVAKCRLPLRVLVVVSAAPVVVVHVGDGGARDALKEKKHFRRDYLVVDLVWLTWILIVPLFVQICLG